MSHVQRVIIVAVALALAACAVRRPEVALANVHLGAVRLDGGSLDILLDIRNPNRWSIDLQELTYELSIDDAPVGKGATTSRIVVPARECATVQLPVDVSWRGIGRGAREMLTGEVEYRVAGHLTAGTPVGTIRLPLRPHEPALAAGGPTWRWPAVRGGASLLIPLDRWNPSW